MGVPQVFDLLIFSPRINTKLFNIEEFNNELQTLNYTM